MPPATQHHPRARNLRTPIGINVQLSATALVDTRTATGARQTVAAAERFYEISVRNESTKRRLGMATLMDVINMQDRLTNALLAEVQARQSYANAIARLRFETGTIATPRDEGFEIAIDDFLRPRFDVATP